MISKNQSSSSLGGCLGQFWPRKASLWANLDALTCSTWRISEQNLLLWIQSGQRGQLKPEGRQEFRLYVMNLWQLIHLCRFALYLAVFTHYDEIIINGQIVKPRFPYYFADIMLLMSSFTLYAYIGAFTSSIYCFLTTWQFHLSHYLNKPVYCFRWISLFAHIEAMANLGRVEAQQSYPLLRHIPTCQYERYRRKFRRAMHIQLVAARGNNIFISLFYLIVVYEIVCHPEWQYPLLPCLFTDLFCQIWYYLLFRVYFNILLILYLNSVYITMLLDSIKKQLDSPIVQMWANVRRILNLFEETFCLLTSLNLFWSTKYGLYCVLQIPCIMVCLYVIIFVKANLVFLGVLVYVSTVFSMSLQVLNLMASRVRTTSLSIYRKMYHSRVLDRSKRHFYLLNMTQIISSKSCKFGIKIGTMGTADQRTTFAMFVIMLRFFMFAIKWAKGSK